MTRNCHPTASIPSPGRPPALVTALAGAILLVSGACTPSRQQVAPEVTFADTPDTIDTKYSAVPEAAWVGGQRWVIVSPEYEEAVRVDFSNRSVTPLGTPSEYRNPAGVFAVGDTVVLADWGLQRFTVWGPGDELLAAIPVPAETRGAMPRARDAAGQYYFELRPAPGRSGEGNLDSAAIIRSSPDLARFDTVAWLAPLDVQQVQGQAGARYERMVFSGVDRWGVRPDGSLWIARIHSNRIVWHDPSGDRKRGPALPDPVWEVTAADRDYFLQQFPEELRSTADALPFALVKPPFEQALADAEGLIWLQKSRPLLDSLRRFQVVGRDGRVDRVVLLPGNGHLVALGDTLALVVEQHLGGLRLLQLRIPAVRPPVDSGTGGGS